MTFILLIRHGQNDWVNKRRLAGWTPGVHLNEEGRKQVKALAERLGSLPIKAVYSSPLERCVETALALAKPRGLEVIEVESIGEVRYGDWQGKKIKKLAKKKEWYAVQHKPSRFCFPGGESFRDVQQRAIQAIEDLRSRHEKEIYAAVSHADVIKLVLAYYTGVHIDLFQRINISPASVSVIALANNGFIQVMRINDNGPLALNEESDEASGKTKQVESSGYDNGDPNLAAVENEKSTAERAG